MAHTRLDSERALRIQADGGPVLLERRFSGDTDALTWGARLLGGYDFSFGDLRSGPFAGLDYSHSRIDDFSEKGADRTALGYEEQDYDSLEASLGWRLQGSLALDGSLRLLPYASVAWVKELGDGRLEDIALTSRADGRVRVAELGDVDTSSAARASAASCRSATAWGCTWRSTAAWVTTRAARPATRSAPSGCSVADRAGPAPRPRPIPQA